MRGLRNILTAAAILISSAASADKGFWPIQDINHTLEKDMRERGIKLRPKEIYNVESPGSGLADAVLTFGFKYSGCFVSNWGLVLTSADPAIDYMARLGEAGQQLLKEGFHAVSDDREIPLEGEKVYSLKRVFDVTEDVKTLLNRGMEYAGRGRSIISPLIKSMTMCGWSSCRPCQCPAREMLTENGPGPPRGAISLCSVFTITAALFRGPSAWTCALTVIQVALS